MLKIYIAVFSIEGWVAAEVYSAVWYSLEEILHLKSGVFGQRTG